MKSSTLFLAVTLLVSTGAYATDATTTVSSYDRLTHALASVKTAVVTNAKAGMQRTVDIVNGVTGKVVSVVEKVPGVSTAAHTISVSAQSVKNAASKGLADSSALVTTAGEKISDALDKTATAVSLNKVTANVNAQRTIVAAAVVGGVYGVYKLYKSYTQNDEIKKIA